MTIVITIVVFATPWLYVRAGQRTITRLGIDPDHNRDHPWKVPPAEIALLMSGIIGWIVAMGLAFAVNTHLEFDPIMFEWMQWTPDTTTYIMPIV